MDEFLSKRTNEVRLISTAASPILGMHGSMTSHDPKIKEYLDAAYAEGLSKMNTHT